MRILKALLLPFLLVLSLIGIDKLHARACALPHARDTGR
jgi:hypothetical protein